MTGSLWMRPGPKQHFGSVVGVFPWWNTNYGGNSPRVTGQRVDSSGAAQPISLSYKVPALWAETNQENLNLRKKKTKSWSFNDTLLNLSEAFSKIFRFILWLLEGWDQLIFFFRMLILILDYKLWYCSSWFWQGQRANVTASHGGWAGKSRTQRLSLCK